MRVLLSVSELRPGLDHQCVTLKAACVRKGRAGHVLVAARRRASDPVGVRLHGGRREPEQMGQRSAAAAQLKKETQSCAVELRMQLLLCQHVSSVAGWIEM